MAYTDINSEDRLVQQTFADHLESVLGWENVYAWNQESFGPDGTLGRNSERDVVLTGHLEAAIRRLRPDLPDRVVGDAIATLTRSDFSRSTTQHNREFYRMIRDGVKRGVERRGEIRPFRLDRPVRLELRWEDPVMTEILVLMRGVRRVDGQTVAFEGPDMLDVARFFEVVHHIRAPE